MQTWFLFVAILAISTASFAADETAPAWAKLKEHTAQQVPVYKKSIVRASAAAKKTIRENLDLIEAGKAFIIVTGIRPQDLKVGDVCIPWLHEVRVRRILSPSSALVEFILSGNNQAYQARDVILENFSTEGMTSDTILKFGLLQGGETKLHPAIFVSGTGEAGGLTALKAVILPPPPGGKFVYISAPL